MKKTKSKSKIFEGIRKSSIELIQEGINGGEKIQKNGSYLNNAYLKKDLVIFDFLIKNNFLLDDKLFLLILKKCNIKFIDYIIKNIKKYRLEVLKYIINYDNIELLNLFFKHNLDIHIYNDYIIKNSLEYNSEKISNLILNSDEYNSDYNKYAIYLINYAIKYNNSDVFNETFKYCAEKNKTLNNVLSNSIKFNKLNYTNKLLNYCIEHNEDLNYVLQESINNNCLSIIDTLLNYCIKHKDKLNDILISAIYKNNFNVIKKIVDTKIDLNYFEDKEEYSDNILINALEYSNYDIVKYLIDNDAKPSLCQTSTNNECLYLVCNDSNIDLLNLIIKYDNVIPRINDMHIIEYACEEGYLDVVKYLINNGFDINNDEYYFTNKIVEENNIDLFNELINLGFNNFDKILIDALYNKRISIVNIIINKSPKNYINDNSLLDDLLNMFYMSNDDYDKIDQYIHYNYEIANWKVIDTYLTLIENGANINYNGYNFFENLLEIEEISYIKTFLNFGFKITDQTSENEEIQVLLNLYNRKQKINKLIK